MGRASGSGHPRLTKEPAARDAIIELQQLTKSYGDKLAVDGISTTIRPGVVTGFLGPNGAGKSTTMRMARELSKTTVQRICSELRERLSSSSAQSEEGVLVAWGCNDRASGCCFP